MIDNTFIINIDHYTDRLAWTLKEFQRINYPWKLERVSGVFDPNLKPSRAERTNNTTRSHLKCLYLALERQYNCIAIVEDDVEFTEAWILYHQFYFEKLQQQYRKWAIYYPYNMNLKEEALKLHYCRPGYCTHFYLIQKKCYNPLIKIYENLLAQKRNCGVDSCQDEFRKEKIKVCTSGHQLVIQKVSLFGSIRENNPNYLPRKDHELNRIMK